MNPHRVQGALRMARTSIPKIAKDRGCGVSTLYAVFDGKRPGKSPQIRAAVADIERIIREVACA